jgi:hypothetical protein
MTPELQAITQRLEEVERQVAHLAALVTEQTDTDRTVEARRFVVRDEQGQRRVELGTVTNPRDKDEAIYGPWLGLSIAFICTPPAINPSNFLSRFLCRKDC